MAYQDMAIPVDIPWKRLATSSDMVDRQRGDRRFPPKWRSSISIFYHEPTDLPETYCERAITYLKFVCSITGYQVGAEVGAEAPSSDDAWHTEQRTLGDLYHPCYGAMLQVAVFPNTDASEQVKLADIPYIMDFEPKRRELYEAVSQSGEILGRSASTLNMRKSATTGETTEYASKIGAEVKGSYAAVSASVSAEHSWGGGTHLQEENVKSTDDSREKRETYSSTTSLTQMYELFTGYHLGSNRAMFYMLARPHTTEQKDQYTFVNGPRRLEGIQEIFVVVNRPREQRGICVEAFLETAHLFAGTAETPKDGGGGQTPTTYTYFESSPVTMFGYWNQNRGSVGDTKDYDQVVFSLPAGCELDTSRPSPPLSFDVGDFGPLPSLTINVPPGFFFDIQDDTFWRSIQSISGGVSGGQVSAKVTLRNGGGNWPPRFNAKVTVYYRCPQAAPPADGSGTPDPSANTTKLFLTSRGISTCIDPTSSERSSSANIAGLVDPAQMFAEEQRPKLLRWLEEHQVLDLGTTDRADYRVALRRLLEGDVETFQKGVMDALDLDSGVPIPTEWVPPAEWVSFECPIPVDPVLNSPTTPAVPRIRAANELSTQLGEKLVESLGSGRRYAAASVTFWQTDVALDQLRGAVLKMPQNHPDNVAVASLAFQHRDALIAAFGDGLRIRDVATFQPGMLARGLGIDLPEARQLLADLLRTPGREREWNPAIGHITLRGAMGNAS